MKKVQLYVNPHKDKILYELIEELEAESEGKRGYVADQLKERLKAFELLSRIFGEKDPMALAFKVAARDDVSKDEEKPSVNTALLDIGSSAGFFDQE